MGYILMKKNSRVYISIYFQNGFMGDRKKRDLTIAFRPNDELYLRCKKLSSSQIKEIIGVKSYADLIKKANKEDRSLSNYIKHKLRNHFEKKDSIS